MTGHLSDYRCTVRDIRSRGHAPQTRDSTSCGVMIAPAAAPGIASAPREMVGICCAVGQVRRDDSRRDMFRASGRGEGPREGSSNVPRRSPQHRLPPWSEKLRGCTGEGRLVLAVWGLALFLSGGYVVGGAACVRLRMGARGCNMAHHSQSRSNPLISALSCEASFVKTKPFLLA